MIREPELETELLTVTENELQEALTLILKFLGYDPDRLPGKFIHQKIMSTYSVFLKLGS